MSEKNFSIDSLMRSVWFGGGGDECCKFFCWCICGSAGGNFMVGGAAGNYKFKTVDVEVYLVLWTMSGDGLCSCIRDFLYSYLIKIKKYI